MSREIKFRAWNGIQMLTALTGWFVEFDGDTWHNISDEGQDCLISRDVKLMQFTGLHDKNGVEIYEGDILNVCNGSLNGVEWMEKPYAVEYVLNKGFNICMFCWMSDGQNRMDSTHWCEVIGNIYENPELLETK